MSAVPGSAAFPVLVEGEGKEEASSSLEIAVVGDSGIRGAETWRISLSGTQLGESAFCGKIQAYPWLLVGTFPLSGEEILPLCQWLCILYYKAGVEPVSPALQADS